MGPGAIGRGESSERCIGRATPPGAAADAPRKEIRRAARREGRTL